MTTATLHNHTATSGHPQGGVPGMDDAEFERWVALLRERTGMRLAPQRKSYLVTSLALRMREIGFEDFASYFEFLTEGRAGRLEWATLVDRLTVQETRFFRDERALATLEELFLPQAAARVQRGQPLHAWSAGCATGEEAFTLAMLLDGHLAEQGLRPYYGVTGSDISLPALAVARAGRYSARRLATVPEAYRESCCEAVSSEGFRIAERLRRRVCFLQMNLLETTASPLTAMDLVYCQNVLIYFERERRERILRNLAARLRPGGLLVLGAGEILGWRHHELERVGAADVLAFRRHGG